MARVKLKVGDSEVEVDSRDFYVDNKTLGEVIDSLSVHLPENTARVVYEQPEPARYGLESLEDAEAFEPEFSNPVHVGPGEVKSKIRILETAKFFDSPRTVSEAVQRLREYGWAASPLDVSKALAKMASSREIIKSSGPSRTQYCTKGQIIA